jgi:undecaprenyl-diphosphatase
MKHLLLSFLTFLSSCAFVFAEDLSEAKKPDSVVTNLEVFTLAPSIPAFKALNLSYSDAIILGLLEGITEYLPISSTGHLIIVSDWLGLNKNKETKKVLDAYLVIIQSGAILAVLFLYHRRILSLWRGMIGRDPDGSTLIFHLILAFLPAAVIGVLLDDWIGQHLFSIDIVAAGLIIGAIFIFAMGIQKDRKGKSIEALTKRGALLIGFMQALALWPGMSRSLVTILGALIVGLSLVQATEFSFLLGLMTLSAASLYKIAQMGGEILTVMPAGPVFIGIFFAMVSALLAIRWLVTYLTTHGLNGFGYYRIILAIVLILFEMHSPS